ncbi:MAG: Crp/Fnr family transcriptional regulator [Terriglobales bacterium]
MPFTARLIQSSGFPEISNQQRDRAMTKELRANRQDFLTAAMAAENRLEYVTPNDWALLLDKAKYQSFAKGEELIHIGRQEPVVIFLAKGSARIVSGRRWPIATVAAGEILGDMAFMEGTQSSATVLAETPIEAYLISWSDLHHLFESYPHLGSRFYRSVAVSLSRRLRRQISE